MGTDCCDSRAGWVVLNLFFFHVTIAILVMCMCMYLYICTPSSVHIYVEVGVKRKRKYSGTAPLAGEGVSSFLDGRYVYMDDLKQLASMLPLPLETPPPPEVRRVVTSLKASA